MEQFTSMLCSLSTHLALVEDLPDVLVVVLPGGVDVAPDGAGEERRVLRDHRQVRTQGVQPKIPGKGELSQLVSLVNHS